MMSKLYPKLQTGRVLPLTETTYTHRPRQDKGYMLQRTVTPYTNNRQIKKSVTTPSSPEQVNVISNYYNTSAGQNVNNPEYKYSTNVPLTGEKHWNIDRFIVDPQYSDYKNLGGLPEKAQIRRNILTDIYKQKLLETNKRNQAFRSAKQFVKTEIDPRVNGAYFNTIKGKSGESSTNFGSYNNLITYRQNSDRYGVNENGFKKGAIDYFKTYEKLSNPVAKEKYQKWFEEANIKGMQDSVSYNMGKMNQFSPIPSNSSPSEVYNQGGTLSQLGYKRHSPYNKAPSLLINTPTGSITMKEVDHPILGISKGEIQIMHPEKEYQFKSNKVLEIPMRSLYPKGQNGMRMPKVYTDKNKFIEANQSYQDSLYLHNVPSLYKENLATEEGAKDVVLNKALPVLKRILNRNNINLEDYVGEWDSENLKFPRPNQPIIFKPKMQQGGTTPEMSPEQQQEIVRRVRNLRKKLPKMGVAYDPISFRHAMYVNKKAFDKEDQELLGAFDEDTMVKLMNEIPNDNQPTYKKGGSIKGKSKMYPKCKCGCGGVSVGKNKIFQQGGTMDVLDEDGNSQMTITGGERIFSRIATKKMLQLNEEGNYKELGKFICDELYLQDKREPQYVKE